MSTPLAAQLQDVRARLQRAALAAGQSRAPELLAVTKSVPPEVAAELARLGQLDLGESRADELARKAEHLARQGLAPRWHFVGHLQRNKAAAVVEIAHAIHSIDSPRLLATVERCAAERGRRPELYVELELGDDPARTGLSPGALAELLDGADLAHARLVGLMTIAPLAADPARQPARARAAFERLAAIARAIEADPGRRARFAGGRVRLSMGMSSDLEIAAACGSDVVRVGSALFEGVAAGGSA